MELAGDGGEMRDTRFTGAFRVGLHSALAMVAGLLMAISSAGGAPSEDTSGAYRVGPEDVIVVTVVRHPEFSGEFYVPNDGAIELPAVGQMSVSGKTLSEISSLVAGRLGERLREPEVTVTLKVPRMQRVYVLGAVEKPGPYDVKPGWRITEAVAAAGGLTAGLEATDCRATVLQAASGERRTVELTEVLSGASEANLAIESGDVLTLEAQETLPVYIMGKVRNPGIYRLRRDSAGVMEALTLAGGTLDDAALDRITVTHLSGVSETVDLTPAILGGKQGSNVRLMAGDLIVVPEETSRIAVLGYVNEPGFYALRSGQKLTLSEAIGMAKGADNKRAHLSSVAVIRTDGGTQEKLVFDLRKFLKSGDAACNPEIRAGDVVYVPETSKPDWDMVLRTLTSLGILISPIL